MTMTTTTTDDGGDDDDDDDDDDNNNNNNNNTMSPKSVEVSHYNQQVRTNRTIPNKKLDIIIHDNKQGTCTLIDVSIPGDRNAIKKDAEKILKYKDLITEIQHMWNVKAKVIPAITGATGTISKSLGQYPRTTPG